MGNGPEDLYLGRYNQQESLRVKIERFKAEVNKKRNTERRDPFNPPLPELKKEEYDPDPLMTLLKKKKAELEQLKNDAVAYSDTHINQEFRRINGTTQRHQLELDKVDLQGREDARNLRRECMALVNMTLDNILMGKLHHEDYKTCTTCLPMS